MLYLLLYCYVILFSFRPHLTVGEVALQAWTYAMMCEEIYVVSSLCIAPPPNEDRKPAFTFSDLHLSRRQTTGAMERLVELQFIFGLESNRFLWTTAHLYCILVALGTHHVQPFPATAQHQLHLVHVSAVQGLLRA